MPDFPSHQGNNHAYAGAGERRHHPLTSFRQPPTFAAMAKTPYLIYGLIDPRNHKLYYIGKTRRVLHDRMDEHFFDAAETLARLYPITRHRSSRP